MNTASADNPRSWWVSADERVNALEVALRKQTYVLPWHQFLYAVGGDDEVRAVFAMHEVIVKGAGLTALLSDLAAQTVSVIREPIRADRFLSSGDRGIRDVFVRELVVG
jgi:hypothetical protein